MSNTFTLKVTARSDAGCVGTMSISRPTVDDSPPPVLTWNGEGPHVVESATVDLFLPGDADDSPDDSHELDGDDWRSLEGEGSGWLADVHKWISHPQFEGGLLTCMNAALGGCDPDGWTDAHERVLELELELVDLRSALVAASVQVRDLVNGYPVDELHQSPEETMARLDRLVPDHEVLPL